MRVVYCADDGTEFETEQECRDYELKTADFFEECVNVRAYDDKDVIDFNNYDMEHMENAFENISYIQFGTQKAIDLFLKKGQDFGLLDIEIDIGHSAKVGERYFYNWDTDNWVCLEDRYEELDKIARIFENK